MSLIQDSCYFCLTRRAKVRVEDKGDHFNLCPSCAEQFQEALDNVSKGVLDLPRKDPSELCVQCGLCCVALTASVDEAETVKFIEQANATGRHPHDVTLGQFCTRRPDDDLLYAGGLVINFPCIYLKGSLLNYVGCRGYDLDRPAVCQNYLCRIAAKYRLGLISLGEAKFTLRSSFLSGRVDMFNWCDSEGKGEDDAEECRVSLLHALSRHLDKIKAEGVPEEFWEWAAAAYLTPEYIPSSDYALTWLNMHFYAVDREEFNLDAYVEPELSRKWSPEAREAAEHTMREVLKDMRKHFIRADEVRRPDGGDDGQGSTGSAGEARAEAASNKPACQSDGDPDAYQRQDVQVGGAEAG